MRLEIKHNLGKEKAIEKIDGFLDKLAEKELPAGIKIENPKKEWSENVMTVSFKAKKSIFGVDIKGTATVFEDHVIIEVDLPAIITSFVSEEDIANRLKSGAQELLT